MILRPFKLNLIITTSHIMIQRSTFHINAEFKVHSRTSVRAFDALRSVNKNYATRAKAKDSHALLTISYKHKALVLTVHIVSI